MKIGFHCESSADRAALEVLTGAILGAAPEPISMDLAAHGVPGLFNALNAVVRGVHYHSDAEALVILVDCDDSLSHEESHEQSNPPECRYCRVRQIVSRARNQLKPVPNRPALKVAIGVPFPAIEAWYLVGKEQVGETAWKAGVSTGRLPRPRLKQLVYGVEYPSLELETDIAVRETRRVVADLDALETRFPVGFGLMAKEIRSWRSSPSI